MGWWKARGTEDSIGDAPLDVLRQAVELVVAEYQGAFDRRPTKSEWESLLVSVLGADEPHQNVLEDAVVAKVHIELG